MNYPTSLDTLTNPTTNDFLNSPNHVSQHSDTNGIVMALEAKLGISASTPTSGKLLRGTGTGSSAWDKDAPTGVIVGTTDTQSLSNKTLLSPTITTAIINNPTLNTNTISEFTATAGVTIDGVLLKDGLIQTNGAVPTAAIANQAVTASKLATGAASAFVATSETTTNASYVDLATVTDTVTVTIGVNGLALVILNCGVQNGTFTAEPIISVALSGANTVAANDNNAIVYQAFAANAEGQYGTSFLLTGLAAGSTTFKMKYRTTGGTATFKNRRISVIPL